MPRQPAPFTRRLTGWSDPLDRYDRHRQLILAKVPRLAGQPVVSHLSAAVLHRLPLPDIALALVHVTRPERRAACRSPVLHTHGAQLSADEITWIDDLPVTTPARTLVDCVRALSFNAGVELLDAALARRLVDLAALEQAGRRPHVPDMHRFRTALSWADLGSLSFSESRARLAFAGLVTKPPRSHVLLPLGPAGSEVCVDLWVSELQLLGVVADPLPGGPVCDAPRLTAPDARAAGIDVITWHRSETSSPAALAERFRLRLGQREGLEPAAATLF